MKKHLIFLILTAIFMSLAGCHPQRSTLSNKLTGALKIAQVKAILTSQTVIDSTQYPRSTQENGTWITKPSWDWTSGFYPGSLWYLYEYSQKSEFEKLAEKWTAGIENERNNTGTHDLGFMLYCSFGNGYRLTHNPEYKAILLKAAESLESRYNPTVGCIKSWDFMGPGTYPVIVDNMMNLELLFWAAKNGGPQDFYDIAVNHAKTTLKNHFRNNNSSFHVVMYDENTGDVLERKTRQGFSDPSSWARGQAWGLYGFTMTYRETKDTVFLNQAIKIADYFINRLPDDSVPFWDFDAPNIPNESKDASAAAIAASGLLELSQYAEAGKSEKYAKTATSILESLASGNYLDKSDSYAALLKHSVGSWPENSEVDVGIIYADYYFIEAAMRYLGKTALAE